MPADGLDLETAVLPAQWDASRPTAIKPSAACRAKMEVLFTPTGLALRNAKHLLHVHFADLRAVYILDGMPEERANKAYILLNLKKGKAVPYGKQQLGTLALEFSAKAEVTAVAMGGGVEQTVRPRADRRWCWCRAHVRMAKSAAGAQAYLP